MNAIYVLFLIMAFGCLVASVFGKNAADDSFAIHLLPENIRTQDLANLNLSKIKLRGKPFLNQYEIGFYNQDRHEFVVYVSSAQQKIKNLHIPTSGRPFVVTVDDVPIYAGAFYTNLSSQSFSGITIIPETEFYYQRMHVSLGYPSGKFFVGKDLRADVRIMKAFQKQKQLVEDLEFVGRCKDAGDTGKRLFSVYFAFDVLSVIKGKLKDKGFGFELNSISPKLENLMNICVSDRETWKINTEKRVILKFEGRYFKDVSEYQD